MLLLRTLSMKQSNVTAYSRLPHEQQAIGNLSCHQSRTSLWSVDKTWSSAFPHAFTSHVLLSLCLPLYTLCSRRLLCCRIALALGWMLGSPAPPDASLLLWAGSCFEGAPRLWKAVCDVLCKGDGSLDGPGDSRLGGCLPSFDLEAMVASLHIVHLPRQPQLRNMQTCQPPRKLQRQHGSWGPVGQVLAVKHLRQAHLGEAEQGALLSWTTPCASARP